MSIDSDPEVSPKKERRTAKRGSGEDFSPALREDIAQAARKIRAAHQGELADLRKANSAGRFFRSIIVPNGKPADSLPDTAAGARPGGGSLAGEIGGLLSGAILAGAGLLERPLTDLTQAWISTLIGLAAQPGLRMPSSTASAPAEASQTPPAAASRTPPPAARPAPPPAAPPTPGVVDTAAPIATAAETAAEVTLRKVFRQFMPMLLNALKQGGDGYGLARTVITLFGRSTYDQAAGLGKDRIMQILQAEPDLWAQVAPVEASFGRFLGEFTGYDAWTEEQVRRANGQNATRRP